MALCHGVKTYAAVKEREGVRVIQSETHKSGKGNTTLCGSCALEFKKQLNDKAKSDWVSF